MKNITGIIGGMGPQASVRLYQIIIDKAMNQYYAQNNDDFPHFVLSNVPVPDTISNEEKKSQLISMLITEAERLNNAGCNKIVMACNTAHLFEGYLHKASNGSFVSMIDLVVAKAKSMSFSKVAVIGSPMTIKSGLYAERLEANEIKVINAEDKNTGFYETIIRNHIAGKTTKEETERLEEICDNLLAKGAETVILGCTELSSILGANPVTDFCLDPLKVLAELICENSFQSSSSAMLSRKPVHTT